MESGFAELHQLLVPYLARLEPLPDARSETRVDVRDDRGSRAESVLLGPATLTLLRTIAFRSRGLLLGHPFGDD